MKIKKIEDVRPDMPDTVTLKYCGNICEIRYMRSTPAIPIQKLDADHYVDLRTGEVKETAHTVNRAEDKASVSQSLRKLRDLINSNLTDPDTALWVTLTYAENMTDSLRLYEDFRRFWQRFRYYLKKQSHSHAEYIIAAEPQGRGAWHLHGLFLFPEKAPFIPNADIARIWKQGFTKTKSLAEIDNPGLYLTAYLGDMELGEAISAGALRGRLAEASTKEGEKKAIVKGARLQLYPPSFHLYRCSRGVQKPTIFQTTEEEAREMIGNAPLTYERTISITDNAGEVKNIINYRQFNMKFPK